MATISGDLRHHAGMRILVVEDEPQIATFVRRALEADGFVVSVAADGDEGYRNALDPAIDLVILDLVLPRVPGEKVLAQIREARPELPVIVLTAKDAIDDRVRNLNRGADDYVTKPFSVAELLARVKARLRPLEQRSSDELVVGPVRLDMRTRTVSRAGVDVTLTAREFALLEIFMRHPGQVLSQSVLLDRVWGYDFEPESNVVEVYVGYLRRKLDRRIIETVRGVGYRFVAAA